MKLLLTNLLAALAVGLMTMTSPVFASTPDGETPAEETVCSEEVGALKGLCNAFCEAMDCNLNEGIHASPKACAKVLDNYLRKSDGIDPPCLLSGCAATATAAANEAYAICITNPKGCNDRSCAKRAVHTYNQEYRLCIRDCSRSCKTEFTSCASNAKLDKEACLAAAGMDTNAMLACNNAFNDAYHACKVANSACTNQCSDAIVKYSPPADSCPTADEEKMYLP